MELIKLWLGYYLWPWPIASELTYLQNKQTGELCIIPAHYNYDSVERLLAFLDRCELSQVTNTQDSA